MKKRLLMLVAVAIALLCTFGLVACGGDGNTDDTSGNGPTKLSAPVVTLEGNVAKWEANENADKFEISLDGNLSYVENILTSKALEKGQSLKVRAVGDGVNYATSDWSNVVTYNGDADTPSGSSGGTEGENPDNPSGGSSGDAGNVPDTPSSGSSGGAGDKPDTPSSGSSGSPSDKPDNPGDNPGVTGDAPLYLGIFVSSNEPKKEDGVPGAVVPRPALLSSRAYTRGGISSAFAEYFSGEENYFGEYPVKAEYDIFGVPGETVYIQIWLNNPSQYTILSLKLNGTKYQIGGDLFSFFVEKNGAHYNCVYAAVAIPENTFVDIDYTVTDIEYIANTFINADGTDEFMNENDTVSVGLPYSDKAVEVSTLEASEITTDSYSVSFDVTDSGNVVSQSGSWLGFAIYDGESFVYNKAISVGENEINASSLAEDTEYTALVYIYGDLHDGAGVVAHVISEAYFTTKSAVDYFEVEADYYHNWDFPEIGVEADSGLCVNVDASLTSDTAAFDRLELYKGEELVYTNEEFFGNDGIEDLLADTEYTVRIYFSDNDYSEHYVEKTVTTGRMTKPEVELQGKYAFLNSALFTFDYIQNGFLRQAITNDVRVEIYKRGIWQLEYKDWILKLCDDPELYNRTQEAFDEAIANGDYSLASKIDHESLTYLRMARDAINEGELGDFGTDRTAWEEYFDTVCRTFYLDTEDFFGTPEGSGLAHLIFRDYFTFTEGECNYKIIGNVNMKDGRGFVETELGSGSIYNFHPTNSENNRLEFDCEINGMNVKVNPYFKINYEDNKILVVSYEIGIYTMSGDLVDTLYTSKEVNWQDFDEEEWINAYVLAMKGEAIVPSEDKIKEYFGWRVIFETLLNVEIEFEDDFTGGGGTAADGTVTDEIVGSDGSIVIGGNGGRQEKNIANEREREIIRALLNYDYPEWYEYNLKDQLLENFMCDPYYYELIAGIEGQDAQLEALISGALNSSISRVLSDIESGIHHFMTWFGSDTDEIYVAYKEIMEAYIEEMGYNPQVNWAESYRRVMMFEDFYAFYPFGYVKSFEINIEEGKYETGEYLIGIKYRYDSYEDGRYETRFDHYNTLKVTGKLPVPTIEISNDGYLTELRVEIENFWAYHFEIEVKNAQGTVVYAGNRDDWNAGGESPRLSTGWSVRARTVFNDGATSDLYNGESAWSEPVTYEGMRLDAPNVEYSSRDDAVKWYADRSEVSHFVYIINDGVATNVPKKSGEYFMTLKYGDRIRVKAVPTDEAKNDGYIESEWAEYTCEDTREMLTAPTIRITDEGKESVLEWDSISGASHYLLEVITASGETYTREEYETYSYGLEVGATYRIRAISSNGDIRSSAYSNSVTFSVKIANPEFKSATADMVRWQSGDIYTQGYYYKIGVNGEVQYTNRPTLYFKDLSISTGDEIYVQAYAQGCKSSDWVLIYTME